MSNKAKVSVLIPVYNVEKYVGRCLESVIHQSLKELEIICVNDGSKDKSLEVLKEYAKKDERIKIVDKPNGGLPSARNAGIKNATGEYLLFLDSDDYIDLNTCEYLYKKAKLYNSDVVIFGGSLEPSFKETKFTFESFRPKNAFYPNFDVDTFLTKPYFYPYLVRNFVRRSFLNNHNLLLDESVVVGEDIAFQFRMFPYAKNVVSCNRLFYHYDVSRDGSITNDCYARVVKKTKSHIFLLSKLYESWVQIFGNDSSWKEKFAEWEVEFIYWNFVDIPNESKKDYSCQIIELFKNTCLYDNFFKLSAKAKGMVKSIEKWKNSDYIDKHNLEIAICLRGNEFIDCAADIKRLADSLTTAKEDIFLNVLTDSSNYDLFFPIEKIEVHNKRFSFSRFSSDDFKNVYYYRLKESNCNYLWFPDSLQIKELDLSKLPFEIKPGNSFYISKEDNPFISSFGMFVFDLKKIKDVDLNSKRPYMVRITSINELMKQKDFEYRNCSTMKHHPLKPNVDNSVQSIKTFLEFLLYLHEFNKLENNKSISEYIRYVLNNDYFSTIVGLNTFTVNKDMDKEMGEIYIDLLKLNSLGYDSTYYSINKSLKAFVENRKREYELIKRRK